MCATAPTKPNRISTHRAPAMSEPAAPEAKRAAWGDAVFAAMMVYQTQLADPDPAVAERAAQAIFELERTRLRHGRELFGTSLEKSPARVAAAVPKGPTKADVQQLGLIAGLAMASEANESENAFDADEFDTAESADETMRMMVQLLSNGGTGRELPPRNHNDDATPTRSPPGPPSHTRP